MQSFRFEHVRLRPEEQIGRHAQSTWELAYVIRGRGTRWLGSGQSPFAAGDVVLLHPGVEHGWRFDAADDVIENITVFFSDQLLAATASAWPELQGDMERLRRLPAAIVATGQLRQTVQQRLWQMDGQDAASQLLTLMGTLVLLARGSDFQAVQPVTAVTQAEQRLNQIDIYLHCNHAHAVTLADVARHVGMNRSALCSFYKRQTSQTIFERLTAIRIEQAKYLLGRPDASVTAVCYAVGFNDLPHFCRVFRQLTGHPPGHYRKRP